MFWKPLPQRLQLLGSTIMKWRSLSKAASQNQKFLNVFWHGKNIEEIFAKSEKFPSSPVATVFKSGVKELKKVNSGEGESDNTGKIENITRALLRSSTSEVAALETHRAWLATTASAAPFVETAPAPSGHHELV